MTVRVPDVFDVRELDKSLHSHYQKRFYELILDHMFVSDSEDLYDGEQY